ncbi:MAG: hypothetical protein A2Z24_01115 [Candidatus Woykebacteria bacterium RBG_16_44_10]|uniref:Cytidyltransferase-like domain-containing protein n=1 Tax=Candidatus Woykebacteria bacterium RBG_16_44_10 TaxID=1802597 RepID=A0A1G1WF89_9BACT|nr:MAG: hypothetical protein A2Z24_01115 [Candidatus Woykebacteria bacterium RBG_16_44_10]
MKKVMTFGTFDILHNGHLSFFRQAKKLGDYLIVVVARDKFVKKEKGKPPKNGERFRVRAVRNLGFVDKTLLGSRVHNFYRTIRTYQPDMIALGYDQKPSVRDLKKGLRRHRLRDIGVVRLWSYRPNIFKSSLLANRN